MKNPWDYLTDFMSVFWKLFDQFFSEKWYIYVIIGFVLIVLIIILAKGILDPVADAAWLS